MNEKRIIQIASDTKYYGLKNLYILKTKAKNKICGDIVNIEIEKNFKNMWFETNACIYTQASAAILANNFSEIYKYGIDNMLRFIEKKINGENVRLPMDIKNLDILIDKKNKNKKK